MAYTTINKHTDYFNTKLTTGTGNSQAVTGLGFQPDLIWGKRRDSTGQHSWFDAVRGITKGIESSTNAAEFTTTDYYSSFDSDGFTIAAGSGGAGNGSSQTAAQWCWKANGQGSANTDGTINSTVSVNQTAGFSIVKFTGSGANATVGHGLGVAPKMYILKRIDGGTNAWLVYHDGLDTSSPQNYRCVLNQNTARQDMTTWNDTAPTNSVFSVGSDSEVNGSGQTYIVYCFAEKTGYSKFGYYIGNFNNNGTFVYTGFKPEFVIVKKRDATGNWRMFDSVRASNINPANKWMNADSNAAEGTDVQADLVSNGFKLRDAANAFNTSGSVYIYMAFGQSLVGSNNVPCTAR